MTEAILNEHFRPADRLRDGKDYYRVNRTGFRKASPHFVLIQAKGWDLTRPCLGLIVSRRVGNAVARNHVKRRIREWFRQNRARFADPSVDLVVMARPSAAGLTGRAISNELSHAMGI